MRDFVVLFLIACHVTIPQASPSVAVDSMEDTNDYELDAIKNSDVDQYEAELHLKSEGLRSSSKYFGNTTRKYIIPLSAFLIYLQYHICTQ